MTNETLLVAAEQYLARGWSIIPLSGKRPALKSWEPYQLRPPRLEEVRTWWKRWPDAGIGVICGQVSGLIVLEVDQENALEGKPIPPTPIGKSGGKGLPHYYFSYDPRVKNRSIAADGKEAYSIRTDGKYVVAPPSLHPDSHRAYEWILHPQDTELATPPQWMMDLSEPLPHGPPASYHPLTILPDHCAFLRHCLDDAPTLAEPHWWAMIHQGAAFDQSGMPIIQEWSRKYPNYNPKEVESKFTQAKREIESRRGPITCAYIQEHLQFPCPLDCKAITMDAKSPAQFARKLDEQHKKQVNAQRLLGIWGIVSMQVVRQAKPYFKIVMEGDQVITMENEDFYSAKKFSRAMSNATLQYTILTPKEHETILDYLFSAKEIVSLDDQTAPEERQHLPSALQEIEETIKRVLGRLDISEENEDLLYGRKAILKEEEVAVMRDTIVGYLIRAGCHPTSEQYIQVSKNMGGRTGLIKIKKKPIRVWFFPKKYFEIPEDKNDQLALETEAQPE